MINKKKFNSFYLSGYASSMYAGGSGAASVYNGPTYKYDSATGSYAVNKDDIYSGSKSMYTKSPALSRSVNLNRSQSVYSRPPPPRTDNYSRNITQSQDLLSKSPSGFTSLTQTDTLYSNKNNSRHDTLYVTNKPGIVKPEPVYGTNTSTAGYNTTTNSNGYATNSNTSGYGTKTESGESSYSTYRGNGSYNSSRSTNSVPLSRTRGDALTPNSVLSVHSGIHTPNSTASYHSPTPQY